MPLDKIVLGEVREVLRSFPADSIDCVVTSPPYWNMRDYGRELAVVWDGDPSCKHRWGKRRLDLKYGGGTGHPMASSMAKTHFVSRSRFCHKCGAWHGQLGLEPHPADFVRHIVQCFSEVYRVLKPSGNLWLNMGDKYFGGGRGQKYKPGDKQLTNKGALNYCTLPPDVSDGSSWLQPKQRLLLPERVAIGMQENGWIVRDKIVWHKKNPMPSSANDRFKCAWEHVFRMTKEPKYYFDLDSVRTPYTAATVKRFEFAEKHGRETRKGKASGQRDLKGMVDGLGKWAGPKKLAGPGANPSDVWLEPRGMLQKGFARKPGGWNDYRRKYKAEGTWHDGGSARPVDVWTIATKGFKGAHFATFPEALVEMCIKPGCPPGGVVLDPFAGSGTTCVVAKRLNRHFIGIDLKPKYVAMAMQRIWPELEVDVKNPELAETRKP